MHYGCPQRIHHDQGGEFNSAMWKELHRFMGIKSSNTTPYHPQGDGQVERTNRTLDGMLKCLAKNEKKDWKKFIPKLAFAYNSTINKSTGFSPFFLMYGRESRLPIDSVFPDMMAEEVPRRSHAEFVKDWEKSMVEAVEIARKNIAKSAGYNKRNYDKKARAAELEIGDRVLMRNVRERGGTGKLRSYWEDSLFKVIKQRDQLPVYEIQNVKKSDDVRVVHRNMLMRCNELPVALFEEKNTGKAKKSRTKKVSSPVTSVPSVAESAIPVLQPHYSDSDEDVAAVVVNDVPEVPSDAAGTAELDDGEDEGLDDSSVVPELEDAVPLDNERMGVYSPGPSSVSSDASETDVDEDMVSSASEEREVSSASSSEETSEDEIPSRPVRTVRPKSVLSYEELGGKPVFKSVTGGKVEKIDGHVTPQFSC